MSDLLQEMRDHILNSLEQTFLDKTLFVGEKIFQTLYESKCVISGDRFIHGDITIIKHPHLEPTQICSFDEDIVKIMEEMGL